MQPIKVFKTARHWNPILNQFNPVHASSHSLSLKSSLILSPSMPSSPTHTFSPFHGFRSYRRLLICTIRVTRRAHLILHYSITLVVVVVVKIIIFAYLHANTRFQWPITKQTRSKRRNMRAHACTCNQNRTIKPLLSQRKVIKRRERETQKLISNTIHILINKRVHWPLYSKPSLNRLQLVRIEI
jgi:hypothetical protein